MVLNDGPFRMDVQELKQAAAVIRAVNNRHRLQILKLIQSRRQINVSTIHREMNMTQSFVSQQLAILRKAGLVDYYRDRQTVYYFINLEKLDRLRYLGAQLVQR